MFFSSAIGPVNVRFDSELIAVVSYSYLEFSDSLASHGTVLYGGLLDRCTVSPSASLKYTVVSGLQYFTSKRKGAPFNMTVAAVDHVGHTAL